ncbi:MAG: O-antigen ligase family protein [Candidatus Obscuribacterales bacterium]|nr:O-antigen ligase family protein [Candidatus Obscuribacterales bacterium]
MFAPLSAVGSWLQSASFLTVVLLFFVLAAQQFTNDKGILALIVLAATGLRLLGTFLGGKEKWNFKAQDIFVLLFFAANIIAACSSHYLAASIKGLSKLAVYICAYFLFTATLGRNQKKRGLFILSALLAAGFAQAVYGVYQYKIGVAPLATWEDPNIEEKTTRIYGTLLNPNLLAGYFVPLVPISLSMAFYAFFAGKWRRLLSFPLLLLCLLLVVACFMTGSRGGYIGMGAGIGSLSVILLSSLWIAKPKVRAWLIALFTIMPIALLAVLHQFPAYEQRIFSIFAGREHSSNSYRLNVYASSWRMFLDSWWLGIGPGNTTFVLAYGLYMTSGFDALGTYSVPLEIAVESGIIGLLTFAALILCLLCRAHITFWQKDSGGTRWLVAGAAAAIVALMAHGLVDTVFYRPQIQLIFWLLAAVIVALRPEGES